MPEPLEYPYRMLPPEYRRINCPLCADFGIVESEGRAHWCVCDSATALRAKVPDLVDRRNRFLRAGDRIPPLGYAARVITQADIDRAIAERKTHGDSNQTK